MSFSALRPQRLLHGATALLLGLLLMGAGCAPHPGLAATPAPGAAASDQDQDQDQEPVDDPIDDAALARTLGALAPQRPGHIDLYALGFAGDASEDAFRNETLYLKQLLGQRFDAAGRVVTLVNHPDNLSDTPYAPLATYDNLYDALARIGKVMDPKEDVLLLFATSHGTDDHTLYVRVSDDEEDYISPQDLRQALDDAGIVNRVIVLSACYSGGFIPALKTPDTLVITAARADRPSFGCGNTADATYFGQAWLIDALNQTTDFEQAYTLAVKEIDAREKAGGEQPSHPQLWRGGRIQAVLQRWRQQLPAAAPVPFSPPPPALDAGNIQAARTIVPSPPSCD